MALDACVVVGGVTGQHLHHPGAVGVDLVDGLDGVVGQQLTGQGAHVLVDGHDDRVLVLPTSGKDAKCVVGLQADHGAGGVTLFDVEPDVPDAKGFAFADAIGLVVLVDGVPEGWVVRQAHDDVSVSGQFFPVGDLAGDEVTDVGLFKVQGIDPFIPADVGFAGRAGGVDQPVSVDEKGHNQLRAVAV